MGGCIGGQYKQLQMIELCPECDKQPLYRTEVQCMKYYETKVVKEMQIFNDF